MRRKESNQTKQNYLSNAENQLINEPKIVIFWKQ